MKISVLGSGVVGQVLADGYLKHGHHVWRGTREPAKLAAWATGHAAGDRARVGTFAEAAAAAEVVVLAVKGDVAEDVLAGVAAEVAGKVVLDATNPIAPLPPEQGVLRFFTNLDDSLLERLQRRVPAARLVKAFSCVGNAHMIDPDFGGVRPSMFICGEDAAAKATATALLTEVGWDAEDMGGAPAARAIEPLCMLWCIPGLRGGQWNHAYKVLRR